MYVLAVWFSGGAWVMCLLATSVFMINGMLLWWTLDSVPLPLVIKTKVLKKLCHGDPNYERKRKVTSIKPKLQAN